MTRTVAIIQARLNSTRLPGKVLTDLAGRPVLAHVVERVRRITDVDAVVVATTTDPRDRAVLQIARAVGAGAFAGHPVDVLSRYYHAAREFQADAIVRITADCPLLDPDVSAAVLRRYQHGDVDYASNVHPPSYPDGLDTEVFSMSALASAWQEARDAREREHVTPFIWNRPEHFRLANLAAPEDLSAYRWTLDEARDLDLLQAIYARLQPGAYGYADVLRILRANPDLATLNAGIARNAGYDASLAGRSTA